MAVAEQAVQDAVRVMRAVAPRNPKRETEWQYQARVARAVLEAQELDHDHRMGVTCQKCGHQTPRRAVLA